MLPSLLLTLLIANSQPGGGKPVKPSPTTLNNYMAETVLLEDPRLRLVERIPIQNEGRIDQLTGLDAVEIEGGWEGILSKLKYGWRVERDPRTNEPIAFVGSSLDVSRTFSVFDIKEVKQGRRVSFLGPI